MEYKLKANEPFKITGQNTQVLLNGNPLLSNIQETSLSSEVQASLAKADTALQAQDIINKTDKELTSNSGKSLIFNETNGGGSKFEHTDGTWSYLGVNDGGENGITGQIYTVKKNTSTNKYEGTRINMTKEGFYYTSNKDSSAYTSNDEIATKGNIAAAIADIQPSLDKADTALQQHQDLTPITELIPAQATNQNQLADKNFVNSSISTATATFKGTVTDVSLLPSTGVDENDYAFVTSTDSDGNTVYSRYKYSNNNWVFEYALNNSSFTAAQWESIQSGITSTLVGKLTDLPTNADLTTALNGKQAVIPNLSTIESGAAAGATAYQLPSSGIPASNLAAAVQTSLGKADTALQQHQSLNNYYTKSEVNTVVNGAKSNWINEGNDNVKLAATGTSIGNNNRCVLEGNYGTVDGSAISGGVANAHVEGNYCVGANHQAHAEGYYSKASGQHAHAEGRHTSATADGAHSEGWASGTGTEGNAPISASAQGAHAEGYAPSGSVNSASGRGSHVEGIGTTAQNDAEHAEGKYNVSTASKTISSIGVGTGTSDKKNAFEVQTDGTAYIKGVGTFDGTNATAGTNDVATVIAGKQNTLVSGTNIKTINNTSILGSGNIKITGVSGGNWTDVGDNSVQIAGSTALATDNSGTNKRGAVAAGYQTYANKRYSSTLGQMTIAGVCTGDNPNTSSYKRWYKGGDVLSAVTFKTDDEGSRTIPSYTLGADAGVAAHAEGIYSTAFGNNSHAEGNDTVALNSGCHSEGYHTIALGQQSHAEGNRTDAWGNQAHSEGKFTRASGDGAHAEGQYTQATGEGAHAEGKGSSSQFNVASGEASHAEGYHTQAIGNYSHTEGYDTQAIGISTHSEGYRAYAGGNYSHAEGYQCEASGSTSHAEGQYTQATGEGAHAEGCGSSDNFNVASGDGSHVEGSNTSASGIASHAEGGNTSASGKYSHAEGFGCKAIPRTVIEVYNSSLASHTVIEKAYLFEETENYAAWCFGNPTGYAGYTLAYTVPNWIGLVANLTFYQDSALSIPHTYLSGYGTVETNGAHAEGVGTRAFNAGAHSEGEHTNAIGSNSHTEGSLTFAMNFSEHAEGCCNKSNKASEIYGDRGNTISSVGIGTSSSALKNAFEVMQNGDVYVIGLGGYDGTNAAASGVKTLQTVISEITTWIAQQNGGTNN